MSDPVILVERAEAVATVTMNRPQARNALSQELRKALWQTMGELDADDDVAAIVLTGADPAFCAGLDLKELAATAGAALGETGAAGDTGTARGPIPPMDTPVIGAVNGVAITGGFELALNCDFLVASENARFADTHSRVGVTPAWGLTARLPGAVGDQWARQMSFTGDFVDAETALRIGLVNEVHAPDALLPRAVEIATAVASTTPSTLARIRSIYDQVRDGVGGDALRTEREIADGGFEFADPEAFAARRDQVFARGRGQ